MSKSRMVVATRILMNAKKGGKYIRSNSEENLGSKIIPRAYVEDRNSRDNNEIYVIDEERTIEVEKLREENIIKNAADAQKAKVSNADVIDALVNKIADSPKKEKKAKKEKEVVIEMTDDEMKAALTEANIEFHHKAGSKKLKELFKTI